ncbi:MAG: carboxypeptidase M32 [Candidatus Cloacimonetes bacterium]|nr:carboxypeptidase M32 [Candidatus Cloacimonadota bacterium]
MEMKHKNTYEQLKTEMSRLASIRRVASLSHWDTQVMMPKMASPHRALQSSAMAQLMHREFTKAEIGQWLDQLMGAPQSSFNQREWFNIKKLHRSFEHSIKLGEELVRKRASLSSRGYTLWQKAKAENSMGEYADVLKEWMDLIPEISRRLYPDLSPYDARLEVYEEGLRLSQIEPQFALLKKGLRQLLELTLPKMEEVGPLPKNYYAVDRQILVGQFLAASLGFDLSRGRIDTSSHPFSMGIHPNDVRLTTRYSTDEIFYGIKSLVHECGHGMYEQGVPYELDPDMPSTSTRGMVIHESQSLFWERMIYKSAPFWEWFFPILKSHFPQELKDTNSYEYYRSSNRVSPGFIRIDADELTYPLHILLRFELETELFSGKLNVSDLPEAWNAKSMDLLGFTPPSLSLSVLQDVHWADGSFGYFPTYTLGAMVACQFFSQLQKANPDVNNWIRQGRFQPILSWLRQNVHQEGALLEAPDLIKKVCNEELSATHYLNYLEKKYLPIYGL